MTDAPTGKILKDVVIEENEDYELVDKELDNSWRHGCYVFGVFKRVSDGTFWSLNWQESGDGEYNSLRDGDLDKDVAVRCFPKEVTKTIYTTVKE